MTSSTKHFVWADIIRIIAILLVIVLHTFSITEDPSGNQIINVLIRVIAKMGVPFFVMLSGALLLTKQESWQTFYQKRLKRVLLPWLFWTAVVLVLAHGLSVIDPVFAISEFRRFLTAEFTFLPLIFCLYLLIPPLQLVVQFGKRPYVLYVVCLWFLAVSLLPFLRNSLAFPLSVDNGLVTQTIKFSGYLLAGWWLSQLKVESFKIRLGLGFLAIGLLSWSTWLVIRSSDINSPMSAYTSPWIIVASMISFLLVVNLESNLKGLSQPVKKWVAVLSRCSFGVFLIHVLVKQQLLPFFNNLTPGLGYDVLLWAAVTGVSFGLILSLSRLKKLQSLVT